MITLRTPASRTARPWLALAVVAALALPVLPALAQDAPPPPPFGMPAPPPGPGGMMGGMGMGGMGMGPGGGRTDPAAHFKAMCENREAHIAGLLAFTETKLKLTEAQKPAWAKLVAAVHTAGEADKARCEAPAPTPPKTLPERLALHEQHMKAALARLTTVRPAIEELYQTLTPEQRKDADTLTRLAGPGHGGGGHGHHGGHHGHGMMGGGMGGWFGQPPAPPAQ